MTRSKSVRIGEGDHNIKFLGLATKWGLLGAQVREFLKVSRSDVSKVLLRDIEGGVQDVKIYTQEGLKFLVGVWTVPDEQRLSYLTNVYPYIPPDTQTVIGPPAALTHNWLQPVQAMAQPMIQGSPQWPQHATPPLSQNHPPMQQPVGVGPYPFVQPVSTPMLDQSVQLRKELGAIRANRASSYVRRTWNLRRTSPALDDCYFPTAEEVLFEVSDVLYGVLGTLSFEWHGYDILTMFYRNGASPQRSKLARWELAATQDQRDKISREEGSRFQQERGRVPMSWWARVLCLNEGDMLTFALKQRPAQDREGEHVVLLSKHYMVERSAGGVWVLTPKDHDAHVEGLLKETAA